MQTLDKAKSLLESCKQDVEANSLATKFANRISNYEMISAFEPDKDNERLRKVILHDLECCIEEVENCYALSA